MVKKIYRLPEVITMTGLIALEVLPPNIRTKNFQNQSRSDAALLAGPKTASLRGKRVLWEVPMQILSSAEVSKLTSISRSHLHRMAREGDFPKPLKISRRRSGWLKEDVEAWISECVRKHRSGGNS